MNSLSQAFCQQRSMRISAALVLCLAMLFVSYPGTSAAQEAVILKGIELGQKAVRGVRNLYREHEEAIQGAKMANKVREGGCKEYGKKYNLIFCPSRK